MNYSSLGARKNKCVLITLKMSEVNMDELLSKLNEIKSDDGSKVNQIVMLALQAFTIMFVMLKPLCKTWMRYKYGVKEDGNRKSSNSSI